jgi:hypothetical protein
MLKAIVEQPYFIFRARRKNDRDVMPPAPAQIRAIHHHVSAVRPAADA